MRRSKFHSQVFLDQLTLASPGVVDVVSGESRILRWCAGIIRLRPQRLTDYTTWIVASVTPL
jgi:hypothetical protein